MTSEIEAVRLDLVKSLLKETPTIREQVSLYLYALKGSSKDLGLDEEQKVRDYYAQYITGDPDNDRTVWEAMDASLQDLKEGQRIGGE